MTATPTTSWLSAVASKAAEIPKETRSVRSALSSADTITSPGETTYGVEVLLGESERFKLYECILPDGRSGILKIAASVETNSCLDREAFLLREMAERAAELEAAHVGKKKLNYQSFIPGLAESFILKSHEGRRVNILTVYAGIDTLDQLVPISALTDLAKVRVDPRTGAWILGKTLKTLVFSHSQAIANHDVTGSNILIERDQHGLIVFDWSLAAHYVEAAAFSIVCEEIAQAARAAIVVMGGDPETGKLPQSDQLVDGRFEEYLYRLVSGGVSDAARAHREFYELIWALWPRGFHPFTAYEL